MSIKKQILSFSKLYTSYEEVPESFLDETDVDSYFYHIIVYIALIDNRIVRVSKSSNKNSFAFKLFQFCNLKNQQRFILEEEVSVSLKELAAILNNLRQFLKQYVKTVKFPALYPLPKPKQEIAFTFLKDKLFAQFFQDIKEHCNRQIRLSFLFGRNKDCCFYIKKLQLVGEQNVLKEIINLRLCEVLISTKNITILPQSVEFLIATMTSDSNILAQVLYQDQSIVKFIGDVTCPDKKCRGEKCVYLTSFKENNKSTYQCKQCKACSYVINILFEYQKPCVTIIGWTYCFRKRTKLDYQKQKLSPLMQQCISQSKFSATKAEEANNELVPKNAKILPYMEQ